MLEFIRLHGPATRSEIARRVGLTVQTVSTIVHELEDQDYVLSAMEEPRGHGLPPTTLRINPEGGYATGLYVSPLDIDAALINLSGDVVESTHHEAPGAAPDQAFGVIHSLVPELAGLRPKGRCLGIGTALPRPFGMDSMSFVGSTTAPIGLLERLAESAENLPNSVSARQDRTAPHVIVARGAKYSVMRGAAALAVNGALSPRFGQLFAAGHENTGARITRKGIAA